MSNIYLKKKTIIKKLLNAYKAKVQYLHNILASMYIQFI